LGVDIVRARKSIRSDIVVEGPERASVDTDTLDLRYDPPSPDGP
jgi:hypothetical protein